MFEFETTPIPGLRIVTPSERTDPRGRFVKTFHASAFEAADLATDYREIYHSFSRRGVLRGMHFQIPPADHAKLVYGISGRVLDVVVDLRRGSPAYGRHAAVELDGARPRGLAIPRGCAHGFLTLSDEACLLYAVTSVHAPDCDTGVHWTSIGFPWPEARPLVSERDQAFVALSDFVSPFGFP